MTNYGKNNSVSSQKSSILYTTILDELNKHLILDITGLILTYVTKNNLVYNTTVSYGNRKLFVHDDQAYMCDKEWIYAIIVNSKKNELALQKVFNVDVIKNVISLQVVEKNILMVFTEDYNFVFYNIKTLEIVKIVKNMDKFGYMVATNKYIIMRSAFNCISILDHYKHEYIGRIYMTHISGMNEETAIIDDIIYITSSSSPIIRMYDVFGNYIGQINLCINPSQDEWKSYSVRITKTEIMVAINEMISFYDFDGNLISTQFINHKILQNCFITQNNVYIYDEFRQLHIYERTI
jgi:hypothetical protein